MRDYAFPPNFGDLLSVRYRDESIQDEWGLDYVDKDVLRNYSYVGAELGDPYYYYREQDSFGLFPVPNKPLVVEHVFENDCPGFTEIYDRTPAADRTVTRSVDIPVSVVLLVDNFRIDGRQFQPAGLRESRDATGA